MNLERIDWTGEVDEDLDLEQYEELSKCYEQIKKEVNKE